MSPTPACDFWPNKSVTAGTARENAQVRYINTKPANRCGLTSRITVHGFGFSSPTAPARQLASHHSPYPTFGWPGEGFRRGAGVGVPLGLVAPLPAPGALAPGLPTSCVVTLGLVPLDLVPLGLVGPNMGGAQRVTMGPGPAV